MNSLVAELTMTVSTAAQTRFQQGMQFAHARQHAAARVEFSAAAAQGHAEAMCWLAIGLHHGMGVTPDPPAAMALYQQAAAAGSAEAMVRLVITSLHGRWLPLDATACGRWLAAAARQRHLQALNLLQLNAGRAELEAGDRSWLAGLQAATVIDQTRIEDIVTRLLQSPLPALQALASDPYVATAEQVLSPPECQYLSQRARPGLKPAMVINPQTGQLVQDPTRNNRSAPLGTGAPDLALALSEWRIARLSGLALAHAEYLAVLCYGPDQEYRPHRDYLHPASYPDQFAPGAPGQRIRTAFAYLNAVEAGGATEFPQLDLRIQPVQGRVVMFHNTDAVGQPDPRSLHAGRLVERGEKWLATLWLRQGPLRTA